MNANSTQYLVIRSRGRKTFAPYHGPIASSPSVTIDAMRRNGYRATVTAVREVVNVRGGIRFDSGNGAHWTIEYRDHVSTCNCRECVSTRRDILNSIALD